MAAKGKVEIQVIMKDGSLETIAVDQPRLTANFLLQQSSLAAVGNAEGYMIGQVFLFAAELRRANGEKIFEDFEESGERLHFSSTKTVFKMIEENADMKEILAQSGGNKKRPPEGEPDDPKQPCAA